MIREFTITTLGDDLTQIGPSWLEVAGNRSVERVIVCEFDAAEEVIGLLSFTGGTYEVGIGEALRGYEVLYLGTSDLMAFDKWLGAVREHVWIDSG